jgi:hypothetical protein
MHKVEVTEIYSYNMIQNDMRSRDPRCVPDWHHRHLHWDLQPQWATATWCTNAAVACLLAIQLCPCSAQRLNSADTARCCRAPNSLRASSLRPWLGLPGALPAERSAKKYQPADRLHIVARRADPDGVLSQRWFWLLALQERRAVSQAQHWPGNEGGYPHRQAEHFTGRYLLLDASLACNKIAECTLLQRACGSDADDALQP